MDLIGNRTLDRTKVTTVYVTLVYFMYILPEDGHCDYCVCHLSILVFYVHIIRRWPPIGAETCSK
jgi:hypothetical protein